MSEAVITVVLTQLTTILEQQIRKEYQLVSGAVKEIKKLDNTFKAIKAVLVDAEKRQVKDQAVKLWLEQLKDVAYDTEDVLSEWITSLQKAQIQTLDETKGKVRSLLNLPFIGFNKVKIRRDISLKIKSINERLDVIATQKERYNFVRMESHRPSYVGVDVKKTTSFVDISEIRGREVDKSNVIAKLLSGRGNGDGLNVVSVIGMGGLGKTTLAQVVYNSGEVDCYFDRRIWVCVSDLFDEVKVAKAILEDIEGKAPYLNELETLVRGIRSYVEGKRFLLVLDDVWTEDFMKWEPLFNSLSVGSAGSSVLVTTRSQRVATVMGSSYQLRLGELSTQDSWSLFSKIAFFERSQQDIELLEGVGRRICEKCKGLPLTIKTIGSLMRFKSLLRDWESILGSEFWELDEVDGLFPPLMLSYYELSSPMKQCFSFCAFFPKDHVIDARNLIQLWMAQGFLSSNENVEMEATGQEYVQNLAMRSFFQDTKTEKDGKPISSLKMHDMVHDFARYLTEKECLVLEVNDDLKWKSESFPKNTRHLTLVRTEDTDFPTSIPNVEKLRCFWVQSFYDSPPIISQLDTINHDLFNRLACIRALDFSRNRIGGLPTDLGKLINLKYLNLSHNPLWELPSTLSDLCNLLSLKLSGCDHLQKLPSGIRKLTKLRHLELEHTDCLKTMPKGIGNLISLCTLSKFIVLPKKKDQEATCGVEDLHQLNALSGYLKIEGLGYVMDANEAYGAELQKKSCISELHMDFGPSSQSRVQDEIIKALQPAESLQFLQISSYFGTKLPDWMVKLTNLEKLFLLGCPNCADLPPLGRLPSLSTLHIEGMDSVKCIGLEFLGFDMNHKSRGNRAAAFPNLKKLKISKMGCLEDWLVTSNDRDLLDEDIKNIMPRLRCLKISDCNKLKALPTLLLQGNLIAKLRVHNCSELKQKYQKNSGENWGQISHISSSRIS